jgi:hypothetical protein
MQPRAIAPPRIPIAIIFLRLRSLKTGYNNANKID